MAKKTLPKPTPEELALYPGLDQFSALRRASALHKLRDPRSVAAKRPFGARSLGEAIPVACRFYARPLNFQLACPNCGEVWKVGTAALRKKGRSGGAYRRRYHRAMRSVTQGMGFDPFTSRWQCGGCMRVFIIGLIAWAPAPSEAAFPPPDQTLNPVETGRLREKYPSLLANSCLPAELPSNAVLGEPIKEERTPPSELDDGQSAKSEDPVT